MMASCLIRLYPPVRIGAPFSTFIEPKPIWPVAFLAQLELAERPWRKKYGIWSGEKPPGVHKMGACP